MSKSLDSRKTGIKLLISHEEEKEMLAAHALGALDPLEARRVEEHLDACSECRSEMEEWRDTASALAYTAPAAEPSPALRSIILEAVRESGARPVSKVSTEQKAEAAPSNVIEMPRRAWNRAQTFTAIAASIAILTLSAALFITWRRLNETQRALAQYKTLAETTAQEARRDREVRELLSSPQSRAAVLAGTSAAPGARAQIVYDVRTGQAMLFTNDLPPAPQGKAYQLWFISGSKVMPGKVFTPDRLGRAMISEQVPISNLDSAPVFAVTLEPSGGVQVATGEKYLISPSS